MTRVRATVESAATAVAAHCLVTEETAVAPNSAAAEPAASEAIRPGEVRAVKAAEVAIPSKAMGAPAAPQASPSTDRAEPVVVAVTRQMAQAGPAGLADPASTALAEQAATAAIRRLAREAPAALAAARWVQAERAAPEPTAPTVPMAPSDRRTRSRSEGTAPLRSNQPLMSRASAKQFCPRATDAACLKNLGGRVQPVLSHGL